jgi:hypothetical protein
MSKETLLQRLRQYEGAQWETTACYNGLRDEAADEIDRLRQAEAERDRLREALEKIVLWCDTRHVATDAGKIARAALAKEAGQ